VVLAGCGGGTRTFDGADARRLASLTPTAAPGWTWLANRAKPDWDTDGEASKKWQDANKLGNLVVDVYANASDAHHALTAFNALSRVLAARSGRVLHAGAVSGLGDEAWSMTVAGNGPQVTYHWRRSNLVFEVHVHCFGRCPHDVDTAARTWAAAIDAAR
jgi:hypothetical protein